MNGSVCVGVGTAAESVGVDSTVAVEIQKLEALCGDVGNRSEWLLLRRSAAERRPSSQPSSLFSPA
jgi:hypothetical protein